MKTALLSFVVLSFFGVPCFAQDYQSVGEEIQLQDGGTVWSYPLPTQPQRPPKCGIFGKNVLCDKEAVISAPVAKKSPSNCRWNDTRVKYVCW
jgi:hypothetical protein